MELHLIPGAKVSQGGKTEHLGHILDQNTLEMAGKPGISIQVIKAPIENSVQSPFNLSQAVKVEHLGHISNHKTTIHNHKNLKKESIMVTNKYSITHKVNGQIVSHAILDAEGHYKALEGFKSLFGLDLSQNKGRVYDHYSGRLSITLGCGILSIHPVSVLASFIKKSGITFEKPVETQHYVDGKKRGTTTILA